MFIWMNDLLVSSAFVRVLLVLIFLSVVFLVEMMI